MDNKEILRQVFDCKDVLYIGKPKGFTRSRSEIYSVKGKKVFVKRRNNRTFFEREQAMYKLLGSEPIQVPRCYYSGEGVLVLDYIESELEKDVLKAIGDWALLHNLYYRTDLGEEPSFVDPLDIESRIEKLSRGVLANRDLFGDNTKRYSNLLLDSRDSLINPKFKTLVHGDLREVNFVSLDEGNVYFDFEFSGIGHPAQDIVSLVLDAPSKKQRLLEIYKENTLLDFNEIKESLRVYLVLRGCDVLIAVKNREIPIEKKKKIRRKFLSELEQCF